MDIFRMIGIGIISAMLAVTIKKWRPEIAVALAIATGILLMLGMTETLDKIFTEFDEIISRCGIAPEYFRLVVKLTGIAYITKFAGEICRDCKENAIAVKVELAGKIAVLALTMPVIGAFITLVIETLNSF